MKCYPDTACDFYKVGHHAMEPKGLSMVINNMTPRSNKLALKAGYKADKIVWFCLNYYIKDFLIDKWNNEFFNKPKEVAVARYKRRMDTSLGKDSVDVSALEELHDLGFLPIRILSLPEGSRVPMKVAPMVTGNTYEGFQWLVNYLESVQSCYLWMPSTNATIADQYYQLFEKYAELTGTDKGFVPFQGHDFSFRGMSSLQSAVVSGMAHLASGFVGTDTIPAIDNLEDFYGANADKELVGCSVVASEHSIACLNIANNERKNGVDKRTAELQFLTRYLDLFGTGIASYVSDTYDYWQIITDIIPTLKDKILARDGKLVVRPDSGDPVRIVCGYKVFVECEDNKTGDYDLWEIDSEGYELVLSDGKYYELDPIYSWDDHIGFELKETTITEAEVKGSIQCLWDTFGGSVTSTGHKLLDPHIGLIYGDSITYARAEEILRRLAENGFASGNVVFGIGSFTYQYNTRDTFGFAVKATYGIIDGEEIEVYKDPKTDNGTKKSARGLIAVFKDENGEFVQKDQATPEEVLNCEYITVFENSKVYNEPTLAEIRQRLRG